MPTAFTHAFAAGAIACAALPGRRLARLGSIGALLAVLPDLDVVSFRLGIEYGHPLGHRGVTHSLAFALVAGFAAATLLRDPRPGSSAWWRTAAVLCACTASHGVLDAFTDAGLGVGFFVPFDTSRHFFPWRPLATSPLSVHAFFSGPAVSILANEMLWVWLPVGGCALLVRRWRRGRLTA